jgi:hypothetical protein
LPQTRPAAQATIKKQTNNPRRPASNSHLVEQLEHGALDFAVAAAAALGSGRADRINLVHEDDRWRVFPAKEEQTISNF